MEGTTFFNMAELVREAALQEAATRSKTRSHLNTPAHASGSTALRVSVEAEEEAEELFAVYEDEKAKNDALARSVDKVSALRTSIVSRRMHALLTDSESFFDDTKQRLEALASKEGGKRKEAKNDEQRRLEIEWQQLEFAIRALEDGTYPSAPNDLVGRLRHLDAYSLSLSQRRNLQKKRESQPWTLRPFSTSAHAPSCTISPCSMRRHSRCSRPISARNAMRFCARHSCVPTSMLS